MSSEARLLRPALLVVLVWALLPDLVILDPLAAPAARGPGLVAALAAVAAAALLAQIRARRGTLTAFAAALDLGAMTGVAAGARWVWSRGDPDLPYIESFSLFALHLATGWGASLMVLALASRGGPSARRGRLPTVRMVYALGAATLGLLTAVVLGVGLSARSAGAMDRVQAGQLHALADLAAAAIGASPSFGTRMVARLELEPDLSAQLTPPEGRPDFLATADAVARHAGGWLVRNGRDRRHLVRRITAAGSLWLWTPANVRPPVRVPDDAPAMLVLALLVLGAPLAAFMVADDLREQLRDLTAALRRMGQGALVPNPEAAALARLHVPIASNDEIGDLAGELNAAFARFVDENRRLAEALGAAALSDQARGRFLAAANHELRTPLNSINGYCHLLSGDALTDGQREDVEVIALGAQQLLRHVDDILDLGRIEAGREQALERAPVDLGALARAVLRAQGDAAAPGVRTGLTVDPATPIVLADPQRTRQVLENLIGNALKFTRQGEIHVRVAAARLPDGRAGARVSVRDTGPGIPEAELDSIFEEFHRVEQQRDVAGTGPGLAIARRFVGAQGGRVWVESVLGEGSIFYVELGATPPDVAR